MTSSSPGIDRRTFAIGILSVTACVLFVGLMLLTQQPVQAIGMNDRGGDYLMLTEQISKSTEAVAVIDAAARQMIVYQFDYNNKRIDVLRQVGLDQLPHPQRPTGRGQPAKR